MTELEIDQSMKFESMRIEHTGESDVPLFGSGYIGFRNLGNTCYLASVMQCISRIPEFQKKFIFLILTKDICIMLLISTINQMNLTQVKI
jgi:uncharacterized UBP type Zn finger protein